MNTTIAALALSTLTLAATAACSGPDSSSPASRTASAEPDPAASAPVAKGIVKVGPTEYDVERSVFDRLSEPREDAGSKGARIVPERENGGAVGMRLFGIRPDSVLGQLGFENGDRLETVNGAPVTSPAEATEAYTRARSADHVTVTLTRKGQPLKLDYNVK
jgi:general secretion pathway protein C